jgi:outer membrane immunogenic protein
MKRYVIASLALAALSSGSAAAADLPLKAPPMVAPSVNWTGCYVGANAGGNWVRTDSTSVRFNPGADFGAESDDSFAAGGQLGCDYQVGSWVFGARGNYDWTQLNGTHVIPFSTGFTDGNNFHWTATATARIGYLFTPQTLLYAQAGAAWTRNNIAINLLPIPVVLPNGEPFETASDSRAGWTIGVGGEYMFTRNVSLFAEANYMNFGTKTVAFNLTPALGGTPNDTLNVSQNLYQVLFGVNLRWGGPTGPVVANY